MPARYRNADPEKQRSSHKFPFLYVPVNMHIFKSKAKSPCIKVVRLLVGLFACLCICLFNASTRRGVALRGSCKVAKD